MKRVVFPAAICVLVLASPAAQATVTNTAPSHGAVLVAGEPVTFAWSTNNLNSPVFGGRVNVVVMQGDRTVLDHWVFCPSGATNTCPTETTVAPLPVGAYEWYVRWWIFVDGPPDEIWDTSSTTSFSVAEPSSSPPPPSPPPPPPPPPDEPPTVVVPTPPSLNLEGPRSARLHVVGRHAVAWATITVERAATVTLSVGQPRTGARLRLAPGSQIGATVSGRTRFVLRRNQAKDERLAVRIRIPLADVAAGRSYLARITAANDAGTDQVVLLLRR
jgi:hypothetical protein